MFKYPLIKDIAALLAYLFFAFVFLGSVLIYADTGSFFFGWTPLKNAVYNNLQYLLILILFMAIAIFSIIVYFRNELKNRRNCDVKWVDLEQIAMHWLQQDEYIATAKERLSQEQIRDKDEVTISNSSPQMAIEKILSLKTEPAKILAQEAIVKHASKFSMDELLIAADLLSFIETRGNISSVASLYEKDPEINVFKKSIVTVDGKTSYEILGTYPLADHVYRVVRCMMEILGQSAKTTGKSLIYARAIIVALAHDLGKIEVKNMDRITGEMYRQRPHEQLSAAMLREWYPEYEEIMILTDAVAGHHISPNSELAKLLKQADHKAREIEVSEWLIQNKQDKHEKSDVLGIQQNEDSVIVESTTRIASVLPEHIEDYRENTKEQVIDVAPEAKEKKVSKPLAEKTAPATPKRGQPKSPAKMDRFELDFIENFGDDFAEALRENIMSVESGAVGEKLNGIPFGDMVLYDYMFYKNTASKIIGKPLGKDVLNKIATQLGEAKILKLVNYQEGFAVSKFVIINSAKKETKTFVPISADFIGFSREELEIMKRNEPRFRGVEVQTMNYSESNK